MRFKILRYSLIVCILLASCGDERDMYRQMFLNAKTVEDAKIESFKVKKLGADGIRIFNDSLRENLACQDSLICYGKLLIGLDRLNELAHEGVYSTDSLPVLLKVIKAQRSIVDSLVTADTIRIITGVDVGYNKKFVAEYKTKDEDARMKMIAMWEKYVSK